MAKEEMYKGGKAVISDKQRKRISKDIDNFLALHPKVKEKVGNKKEIFKRIALEKNLKPSQIAGAINAYIPGSDEKGSKFKKDGKMYTKAGYTQRGDSKKSLNTEAMKFSKRLGLVKDGKDNPSPSQMDKNKIKKSKSKSKGSPSQRNKKSTK